MFLSSWLKRRHASDAARTDRARVKPAAFRPRLEALEDRLSPSVASATAITASLDPAPFGQPVTFTAAVTGDNGTPTGAVEFSVNGAIVGIVPLGATGTAAFTASSLLPLGGSAVRAVYDGDATYRTSRDELTEMVIATTTTTLTASASPAQLGQSVTFTATVTGGDSTPSGQVEFDVDGAAHATVQLDPNGHATFATSALIAGLHTVVAVYSGSHVLAASQSPDLVEEIHGPSTTVLTSSANPVQVNQPVTFTATVTGVATVEGDPVPATGSVSFLVDGIGYATVALGPAGTASFTTTRLTLGFHTVTAEYSGSQAFGTSGTSLEQNVEGLASSLGYTLLPTTTPVVGQPFALSVAAFTNQGQPADITGATAVLQVLSAPAGGTLLAPAPQTASFVGNIAVFDGLSATEVGQYIVRVIDTLNGIFVDVPITVGDRLA